MLPFFRTPLRFLVLLGVLTVVSAAGGSATSYFRSGNGVADSTAGPLPDRFDSPDCLRWRTVVESGHSTPVLAGGKVFLTGFRSGSKELLTMALDEATGQTLWTRAIPVEQAEQTHAIGSPATATPACDDRNLFVFFGSYGLVCYDFNGGKLWEHRLGPFQDEYGAGSSPILLDGKVILNQDHDRESFLAAFDANTGKVLWKTARPDAVRSYATPAAWVHEGHTELLVAGALELAAYEPRTGEKLWWINGLARIVIPTPVPVGDRVYVASWSPGGDAGRRLALDSWPVALEKWDKNHDGKLGRGEIDDREVLDRFYRIDLDQNGLLDRAEWDRHADVFRRAQNAVLDLKPSGRGQLADGALLWKYQRGIPYVATPLLDRDILWMVKDGGIVTKLAAADGRVLQEERLPGLGNYFASPVSGDGKVYFASEPGVLSVVADKADWEVISSREFHERIYASPVIDRDRVYVRTEKALYCFQGHRK